MQLHTHLQSLHYCGLGYVSNLRLLRLIIVLKQEYLLFQGRIGNREKIKDKGEKGREECYRESEINAEKERVLIIYDRFHIRDHVFYLFVA